MLDLIVLGGGPAGLTATLYALRKRLNVLLISPDLGGKTNFHLQLPDVEQHLVINGSEVVDRFINEIRYLRFAYVLDKAAGVERIAGGYAVRTAGDNRYEARALIVATGARPRRLYVPGEEEFAMRGLCYSAISYASLFIERHTIVIGDGPGALRAAAELALHAAHVTLLAPNPGALDGPLAARLLARPNVACLEGYRVIRVLGDRYARGVLAQCGDRTREVRADGIFVELGLEPNTGLLAPLVTCNPAGYIRIDTHNRTSAPGVFAAGDVTDAYAEQVLIALGEGTKAALSAYEYLLNEPEAEPARAQAGALAS